MKVHNLLFSSPMVRALLDGRKTQTRRIIKPDPKMFAGHAQFPYYVNGKRVGWSSRPDFTVYEPPSGGEPTYAGASRYLPGDLIYVRETWAQVNATGNHAKPCDTPQTTLYRATCYGAGFYRWRPAIHMPRRLSRLTLEATTIRVERLRGISADDARAEGVTPLPSGRYHCGYDEQGEITCKSPVTAFAWLWNGINAARGFGWEANPYVVAITFRVHHVNVDALLEARTAA